RVPIEQPIVSSNTMLRYTSLIHIVDILQLNVPPFNDTIELCKEIGDLFFCNMFDACRLDRFCKFGLKIRMTIEELWYPSLAHGWPKFNLGSDAWFTQLFGHITDK